MNYAIDTGNGDQLTTGLPERTARRTAQRIATERGETVYLYAVAGGDAETGEAVPVEPEAAETTTEQLQQLRTEAAGAGDLAQVALCDAALAGDDAAMARCARVIADAAAME